MSDVKMVLLNRYNTLHEANIVLSYLKSKDIDATLFDQHTVNIYATPAIFSGIRLMVPSHQLEKAQTELSSQLEFSQNNKLEIQGDPCPKCKSTSTEITDIARKDLFWLVASILFVFPMLKESSRDWFCHSCQNKWSEKSSSFENKPLLFVIQFLIYTLLAIGIYYYIKHPKQ